MGEDRRIKMDAKEKLKVMKNISLNILVFSIISIFITIELLKEELKWRIL